MGSPRIPKISPMNDHHKRIHVQPQMLQMLRLRIHLSPSFQFRILLPNSICNYRNIGLHALFIGYRVPIIRGVVIPVRLRSDRFRDIKHGRYGRCEDEAFEGWVISGRLEDGEGSGYGGIDVGLFEG